MTLTNLITVMIVHFNLSKIDYKNYRLSVQWFNQWWFWNYVKITQFMDGKRLRTMEDICIDVDCFHGMSRVFFSYRWQGKGRSQPFPSTGASLPFSSQFSIFHPIFPDFPCFCDWFSNLPPAPPGYGPWQGECSLTYNFVICNSVWKMVNCNLYIIPLVQYWNTTYSASC